MDVHRLLGAVYVGLTFLERNLAVSIKILKDVVSGNYKNLF